MALIRIVLNIIEKHEISALYKTKINKIRRAKHFTASRENKKKERLNLDAFFEVRFPLKTHLRASGPTTPWPERAANGHPNALFARRRWIQKSKLILVLPFKQHSVSSRRLGLHTSLSLIRERRGVCTLWLPAQRAFGIENRNLETRLTGVFSLVTL